MVKGLEGIRKARRHRASLLPNIYFSGLGEIVGQERQGSGLGTRDYKGAGRFGCAYAWAFGRKVRFSTPRTKTLRLRSGQALSAGTPVCGEALNHPTQAGNGLSGAALPVSIALLESFYSSGKPIALVCHAPGVLRHVKYKGEPLVKGKHVTGFTNGEEEAVGLTKVVPFLVEDELLRLGAIFEKMANWQPFSITDGHLVTGQNPASSTVTAQALLKLVGTAVPA